MIATDYEYIKPSSIEEITALLKQNKKTVFLAGGTELIISMRCGSLKPERVIDIKNIPQLKQLRWEDGNLFMGSAVTWTEILHNKEIKEHFPALTEAAKVFGCHEIRNRATIGGNLCNASPGAEGGGPCVVYEAKVKLINENGQRVVPISEFLMGPGKTSIRQDEIMEGILLSPLPQGSISGYRRVARVKGQDLATCAITLAVINPQNIQERKIWVGMSAVEKTAFRAVELENILSGKALTKDVLEAARTWIKDNLNPRASSLRGTPDYKKEVLANMLEILLREFNLLI
jgi:CO/xanthine dehydrogenase FAD-binding subunit